MRIKQGAGIAGLKPEMVVALMVIEPVLAKYSQELVLTEGVRGSHIKGSRHYLGYAIDIRIWTLKKNGTLDIACTSLQDALSDEFVVIPETDHIHIHYIGHKI